MDLTTPDGRILQYLRYGPPDGVRVILHTGSPSTRLRRPAQVEAIEASGVSVVVVDRPGYGGSTRQPGRTVTGAAADTRLLTDALGWDTFAVQGGSGGGPHALACAALLGDRVTRCAVVSGIRPPVLDGPDVTAGTRLARHGEPALRPHVEEVARAIMDRVADGGPEIPGGDGAARDDPAAMARLRATFVDSHDGWIDDAVAFVQPWGFDLDAITAPVGFWYGPGDAEHAEWLLRHVPGAEDHPYAGGHIPGPGTDREIFAWLCGRSAGNEKVWA